MTGTGKIHIYYGNGKGKTTAAVGQIIRAAGSGLRVLVFQFLKDNSSSERVILEQIPNITCLPGREKIKFFNQMNGEEKAELKHYNTKALDEIVKFCSPFDVLFLDEILCAVQLGLLNEDKLLRFLEQKPRGLEIIMTGHDVSERMLGIADYVTEMMKIKHPSTKDCQPERESNIKNIVQGDMNMNATIKNYEDVDSWKTIMFLYNAALKEVGTKLEILNDEFQHVHQYNPIEHIKTRIKTPESIVKN